MPASPTTQSTDILVIGWGLAGLVAASEAVAAGRRVVIVDQEPRTNLGGQAPGRGQILDGGQFLHAISRSIHDREGFSTLCGTKVFVIMKARVDQRVFHDREGSLVSAD